MQKVVPHLWFEKDVEVAVGFYVSLLPDSRIDRVVQSAGGSVTIVEFTLAGTAYSAFEAGAFEPFTAAISFMIHCDDQAELDRIWDAILTGGGTEQRCGWIRDRWGLSWQIVPRRFGQIMAESGPGAQRAAAAMMTMTRLDIAALEAAYQGGEDGA